MSSRIVAFAFLAVVSGCATPFTHPHIEWPAGDSSSASFRGVLPTLDAVAVSGRERRAAHVVLDTGCEGVALSSSLVDALGLPSLHKIVRYDGSPVEKGGVGQGQTVTHGLGRLDVPGCFSLEGGEVMSVRMPGDLDALAGLNAFDRVVVFDPPQNRVHFVTRDLADQLAAVEGAISLPAKRKHNTLRVQVTVASLHAELLVDTGARYSWISPAIARGAEVNGTIQGRVFCGTADLGLRVLKVESDGVLEGGLGADILLGLGRAVLLDLERERVVLMPVLSSR